MEGNGAEFANKIPFVQMFVSVSAAASFVSVPQL